MNIFRILSVKKNITDLIVFGFQKKTQYLHEGIDQLFKAVEVREYTASEKRSVERVLMNFLPDILAQAPFWD